MLNKLSYNQIKLFRFIASVVLVCVYVMEIVAKPYLPKTLPDILVIAALIFYIISIIMSVYGQRKSKRVMIDELTKQNEARAAQLTYLLLTIAVFIGLLLARLADDNITLSYKFLFCVLISISAFNDGCYLYLEGRGANNADFKNQD